jgi:hypothetical protein
LDVFDDGWINLIHCILWKLKRVDEWVFHHIMHRLSSEGTIPVDTWKWFGEWPRSTELDALIGFLKMLGVVKAEDGILECVKPPVVDCRRIGLDYDKIKRLGEEFKQLSAAFRLHR